jgi:hypothetical protein
MGQLRGSQNSWGVSRRRRVVIGAGTHLLSGSWAVVEGEVVRLNAGCGRRPNSSELPIVCWKAQARLRSPHMTPHHQYHRHFCVSTPRKNYTNANNDTPTRPRRSSHQGHRNDAPAASFGAPFLASIAKLCTENVTFPVAYFCSVPN